MVSLGTPVSLIHPLASHMQCLEAFASAVIGLGGPAFVDPGQRSAFKVVKYIQSQLSA